MMPNNDAPNVQKIILELIEAHINSAEDGLSSGKLKDRAAEMGLSTYLLGRVFDAIDDLSLKAPPQSDQKTTEGTGHVLSIAYEGTEGSYSDVAIDALFSKSGEHIKVGYHSVTAAFKAVENDECDVALLAIETTPGGSVTDTYDLLAHTELLITDEWYQPTEHCLLALEDVPMAHIKKIYAHPLAQQHCSVMLASMRESAVESIYDTAASAKRVSDDNDLSHAAIASERAADIYGLKIIRSSIADHRDSFTRFVVVSKTAVELPEDLSAKTSMLLVTEHHDGALAECLNILAQHSVNMTKLESHPVLGAPDESMFYIDFEGNPQDENVAEALSKLRSVALRLRILGTYPNRKKRPRFVAPAAPPSSKDSSGDSCNVSSSVNTDDVPFKLVRKSAKQARSVFDVKGVRIGEGLCVIAGPCAIESRELIMDSARIVKEYGGHILRGGAFKPRSSPYSFQGLGVEGLEYLQEAGAKFDLPTVTEVLEPEQVKLVVKYVDILQIGARNMQNFALLKAVGLSGRPVFLKRGMMSSIEEWLLAAEYILAMGNSKVVLCERGIRSFDRFTRNTLDISAVPVARSLTHLPVFVDPSHACGVREWVGDLALAGVAVRANGIMVEIHPKPKEALCDKQQALSETDFHHLMHNLNKLQGCISTLKD